LFSTIINLNIFKIGPYNSSLVSKNSALSILEHIKVKFRHGKFLFTLVWWEENLAMQDRRDQTLSEELGSWDSRHTLTSACCAGQT